MGLDIIRLSGLPLSSEISFPKPEKLIEGPARQVTDSHYEGANGRFFSGFWSSDAGAWTIDCTGEEEYCRLLEGEVELTSEDGMVTRYFEGDEFIIPAGFKGVWRTVEPCRKLYVIAVVG